MALGRAIVRKPTVSLMDEPLSNLDAKLRVSTRAQIRNLQSRLRTTTVYVTHDRIEAMTLTDRVVVMNAGRIRQVGTPTKIHDRPRNTFAASIGSPAMNLIEGRLAGGTFEGEGPHVAGLPGPDGPRTPGFRAEDAAIAAAGGGIEAPISSIELPGEASMITWRLGEALVSVKTGKEFRARIGDVVGARVPAAICHLFDVRTGARIDAGGALP
jgi:multiple sugar transport system ATP-binding protein